MATAGSSSSRIKEYKSRGASSDDGRKKRQDDGIQLRKSKREEQLSKRRNVSAYIDDNGGECNLSEITTLQKKLYCKDEQELLSTVSKFRKLLSSGNDFPLIENVVSSSCLSKFVEFLTLTNFQMQFESSWVITNIASGSSLHTKAVVEAGAVPPLIQLLKSADSSVSDQAMWALGNIAGDGPEARDIVLNHGVMGPLLSILSSDSTDKKNATWTLSNLCRGKNPLPDSETVMPCVPSLSKLMYHEDKDVLINCLWSIAFLECSISDLLHEQRIKDEYLIKILPQKSLAQYLRQQQSGLSNNADGPNDRIQKIVDGDLCNRLPQFLMHSTDKTIVAPALRAVGNILTGNDLQTQIMINSSVLPALQHLLSQDTLLFQKEVCWALSNITAGNRVQIQEVINCNIFPTLINILSSGVEFKIRKEAAWAILNATSGGTPDQIRYLVTINCIKPLCDMLTIQDSRMVVVCLEGLENILKIGNSDLVIGSNPYSTIVEEAYGLEKIEFLQMHSSNNIYMLAGRIIEKYFSGVDVSNVN